MWHLLPPSALLLLISSVTKADPSKAVVLLDPPWVRVLTDDNVTLTCQGAYPPENNNTRWFHNGTHIVGSQAPSYLISGIKVENSGKYQCQTDLSPLSDSVQLQVHADWLVLQTSKWVFQKGESIRLRCHSWKNKRLYKVTYLQNGKPKKFFHNNSEFHIPEATVNHTGSYYCRGLIGHNNKSSGIVAITFQGPSIAPLFPLWQQIAFCLMMGLLFAVDTGLYFFVRRDLRRSMVHKEEYNFKWSQAQDK